MRNGAGMNGQYLLLSKLFAGKLRLRKKMAYIPVLVSFAAPFFITAAQ